MRRPVIRQRNRLLLGVAAAVCSVTPVLVLNWASPAFSWASPTGAPSTSAPTGTSSSTAPPTETPGDTTLDALMLATPLPGLVNFTLVGPGATNGALTAQTLGSYSSDPHQVEHLFNQYSSESGFAGWIKTWQDSTGSSLVVEIAIRFHQASEAVTNASAFVSTLSKGLSGGARTPVSSIPHASAFTIDEPASTSGDITVPAQQVQAVVFSDGNYLIALHTDSPDGSGSRPIAAGTAIALALQQYEVLSPAATTAPSGASPAKKASAASGSAILVVGLVMLGAVAVVVGAIAFVSWRRRQSHVRRGETRAATARHVIGGDGPAKLEEARSARGRAWPEASLGPDPSQQVATAGSPDRSAPDPRRPAPERSDRPGTPAKHARLRTPIGRLGKISGDPALGYPKDEQLVQTGAPTNRGTRSQRLANSRTKHPSASVALARARPPADVAGWYSDPSDSQERRIRYWDGNSWTSHVAEPEV